MSKLSNMPRTIPCLARGELQAFVEADTLAVEFDCASAQLNLGLMYDSGKGVPQDHSKAVKYYTLAADQGFAQAQCSLGTRGSRDFEEYRRTTRQD